MSSISNYFTAKTAQAGIKIDLPAPDGSPSDNWLIVRGEDSAEYKAAYANVARKMLEAEDPQDRTFLAEMNAELAVATIAGWSFEEEVNAGNVKALVENAPYIWELAQQTIYDRSKFVAKKSVPSSTTPKKRSSSTARSRAAKSPKGSTSTKSGK